MNENITHQTAIERIAAQTTPRSRWAQGGDSSERSGQVAPKGKFVAKGHDAQLQDAQFNNTPTVITTLSGNDYTGIISRRDRYTITIKHRDGVEFLIYKHAIESVEITKPAKVA